VDPGHLTLCLVGFVGLAVALSVAPTPVPVRALVVLPALVLVAGGSAAALVLGRRDRARGAAIDAVAAADGADTATDGDGDGERPDALLRPVLTVLFGLLALLASTLLLAVLRVPLSTRAILLSTAGLTLVLLLAARGRTVLPRRGAAAEPVPLPSRSSVRAGLGVTAAVLLLVAAVAGAIAIQPTTVDRYTQLSLDNPGVVRGEPLTVAAGRRVLLRWTLSSYGYPLTRADPTVDVTVGGVTPVAVIARQSSPGSAATVGTGPVDRLAGTVDFVAPNTEGLYTTRLAITPNAAPVTDRTEIVVTMQVTR
jgi:hypothetical protein